MPSRFRGRLERYARVCWVLLLLWAPGRAQASPDTYGAGDGHTGEASFGPGQVVVNNYVPVSDDIEAGDTSLRAGPGSGLAGGDLILIWQATGVPGGALSSDATAFDLKDGPGGVWELARVTSVMGTNITLDAPVVESYLGGHTQLVRIPEYTDLTIEAGAALVAAPWDPATKTGGVLAVVASGQVTLEGELLASGLGHRGGVAG